MISFCPIFFISTDASTTLQIPEQTERSSSEDEIHKLQVQERKGELDDRWELETETIANDVRELFTTLSGPQVQIVERITHSYKALA